MAFYFQIALPIMDRPLTPNTKRRNQIKRWARIVLIAGLIALAFFLLRRLLVVKASKDDFRIAQVERGDIQNSISSSGLVVPFFEQQINAPVSTEIKEVYRKTGEAVEVGDLIIQLDEEFVRLNYESLHDELEVKKTDITRLKLEYEKDLKELDYNDQIKALELENLQAQVADAERLQALGSATQEELEKAQLALQIAELEKKKLENELQFRRTVIKSDERKLDLETLIKNKELQELSRKLKETKVKAPRSGVITYVNESIGKKVQEGENLVRLADLEAFRIEASCSDRYAEKVKVGMPALVRINRKDLNGVVTGILPTVENNTLSFLVELEEVGHSLLRPNLRVEVFVVAENKTDVLRVANGPAFSGGRQQEVFVIQGEEAIRTPLKIGISNRDFVEIEGGAVSVGDRIIISETKNFDHLQRFSLQ